MRRLRWCILAVLPPWRLPFWTRRWLLRQKWWVLLLLVLLAGCTTPHPQPNFFNLDPSVLTLCENEKQFQAGILRECRRKYRDPFVLISHGCDYRHAWYCHPDGWPFVPVTPLAEAFHEAMPGRPIVLWICNPGHHHLHIEKVYWPDDYVWLMPDHDCDWWQAASRFIESPGSVGSIFSFKN